MLPKPSNQSKLQKKAFAFIIFFGFISLFADVTYEGARSIIGPYLGILGASAAVIGTVVGFGEFVGYGLRLFTGWLADRTGRYWLLTILGYTINLLAVPLLAFTGNWPLAAALIVAERLGKAVRTPARDAILSQATSVVGHGKGFGLHEAMDQIGAVSGPLLVSGVLFYQGSYQTAFFWLFVPALLCLAVLAAARFTYKNPKAFASKDRTPPPSSYKKAFYMYLGAVAFIALGFADFPLIAFHFKQQALLPDQWIPITYALAMGVDAAAGLILGAGFDRKGIHIMIPGILLTAGFAPLAFLGGPTAAVFGVVLWGIGMGMTESVMRAVVANMIPADRRGWAYGLYNGVFGVAWFAGSAAAGFLYDVSIIGMVLFLAIMQLTAIAFIWSVRRV